jgi:hypothetical protein
VLNEFLVDVVEKKHFNISDTRKLAHFGFNNHGQWPFDFEWPKEQDIILPSEDGTPVRAVALEWQKGNCNWITGVRLVLSTGQKSPLFLGQGVP